MEEYIRVIEKEIFNDATSYIIYVSFLLVGLVLAICYLIRNKFLVKLLPFPILFAVVILGAFLLGFYLDNRKLFMDLEEKSFVEYTGEIEFDSIAGEINHSTFYRLKETPEVEIESDIINIPQEIKRCNATLVYAKNSKILVYIKIHNVIEKYDISKYY